MNRHDGPGGKRGGKAPWVYLVATITSVSICALGTGLLSSGTQKAIAVVVGLIVGVVIDFVGYLLALREQ